MKLKNFKQLFERESFFDRSEWFRDKMMKMKMRDLIN